MEHIKAVNPERIKWCCADFGITLDDLRAALGIAADTIQRVMDGQDALTFNQLRKMADYFGRGVLFFLETGTVEEAFVHTQQFRTLANEKPELTNKLKTLIERVEQQREVYLSLREELDETAPQFRPPDIPLQSPPEAARIARTWLELGDTNSFDSYRTAVESRGVLAFLSNGYNGKWQIAKKSSILGFTLYDPACPVIVIKKQHKESRQSFTLMHEMGHLLLHKASSIDDEDDLLSLRARERDANSFSGYLLIPDRFLTSISDKDRPLEVSQYDRWLEHKRKEWGVSSEVILRRLLDRGRLEQGEYTAYQQWREHQTVTQKDGGNRQYRYREPVHVFGNPFVRTVLDALSARHITLARASSYLDSLKIEDLHQLESYFASL